MHQDFNFAGVSHDPDITQGNGQLFFVVEAAGGHVDFAPPFVRQPPTQHHHVHTFALVEDHAHRVDVVVVDHLVELPTLGFDDDSDGAVVLTRDQDALERRRWWRYLQHHRRAIRLGHLDLRRRRYRQLAHGLQRGLDLAAHRTAVTATRVVGLERGAECRPGAAVLVLYQFGIRAVLAVLGVPLTHQVDSLVAVGAEPQAADHRVPARLADCHRVGLLRHELLAVLDHVAGLRRR